MWLVAIGLGITGILLGLILRLFVVTSVPINYKFFLHAHSHTMLLGWLQAGLILILYQYWKIEMPKAHRLVFYFMAFSVLGMLASFPLQGYAAVSISFTTLHLWLSYVLLYKLSKLTGTRELPDQLLRTGVVFYFLSSIGPYLLGPLSALEMQSSPWYNQAIFFYLHFLIDGAFFFMFIAYMFKRFRPKVKFTRLFYVLLVTGTFLTWFHKLDYSFDQTLINLLAFTGSVLQLLAGILFLSGFSIKNLSFQLRLILLMLLVRWVLQLTGSLPLIADLVTSDRYLLIAYLHFLFLGIYTPAIWEAIQVQTSALKALIHTYWILFFLTELALVLPSTIQFIRDAVWSWITFGLYLAFVITWVVIGWEILKSKAVTEVEKRNQAELEDEGGHPASSGN